MTPPRKEVAPAQKRAIRGDHEEGSPLTRPESYEAAQGIDSPYREANNVREPLPAHDCSLHFLLQRQPVGPWQVCYIPAEDDGRPREWRTFGPENIDELRRYLERVNKQNNVHWTVNPPRRTMVTKPCEADVIVHRAHVDVDLPPPPEGMVAPDQVAAFLQAQLEAMHAQFERFVPRPTALVFTGGGYQAFWDFGEPVEDHSLVKSINEQIAQRFDGDGRRGDRCHSVDHLMRLAGTINHPKPSKVTIGRRKALAQVVWDSGVNHRPEDFFAAGFTRPDAGAAHAAAVPPAKLEHGEVRRLQSLDDLPTDVPEDIKEIIRVGSDPDDPDRFKSDSEAQWLVTCALARYRVPPELIVGILTDPQWGVSRTILKKKRGAQKHAWGQVEKAMGKLANRPRLQLPQNDRQHRELATDVATLLRANGDYYDRAGHFTQLTQGRFHVVKAAEALTHFERVALFGGFVKGRKQLQPRTLLPEVSKVLACSAELLGGLPKIELVTDCPVLLDAPDGVRVVSGYDEPARLFAHGRAPLEMSLDEARHRMLNLLRDFDPVDPSDLSRLVAAFYSPAMQHGGFLGPERFPLIVLEGDKSQAGKGLACRLIARTYNSKPRTIARESSGNAVGSFAESIGQALVDGEPFIQIDNVRGVFRDAFLEAVLTEPSVECRVLRFRAMIDTIRRVLMLTSNQAELNEDLSKRGSFSRIRKRPDDYVFHPWPEGSITQHVIHNQPMYLGVQFAFLREWKRLGMPRMDGGGHDLRAWAGAVRYINMRILGLADPIAGMRAIQARVTSVQENWTRAVVLALVKQAKMIGATLRTSDLLTLCVEDGLPVPEGREGDDYSNRDRARVAWQAIGKYLNKVFRERTSFQVDGWLLRRAMMPVPRDKDPGKQAPVYRVDPFSESPPPWTPNMQQREFKDLGGQDG